MTAFTDFVELLASDRGPRVLTEQMVRATLHAQPDPQHIVADYLSERVVNSSPAGAIGELLEDLTELDAMMLLASIIANATRSNLRPLQDVAIARTVRAATQAALSMRADAEDALLPVERPYCERGSWQP